jgi:hypothetical protein
VGIDDRFFDLGGNSLLVVQMRYQVGIATGTEPPVVELFRHPTIRSLAEFIGRSGEVADTQRESAHDRAKNRRNALQHRKSARREDAKRD